jgi:hypothetical protein
MAASAALASALDKWRARWPEWNVGASFVAAADRETVFAWFALLQELTDAAWSGADATPGLAKLAWWHEELIGWSKGARRHPLGEALRRGDVDWTALARALRALQATREQTAGIEPDIALGAVADAIAVCERVLFAGEGGASDVAPGDAASAALVRDLLDERALLFADAGVERASTAADAAAPLPRRLHRAFLRERLRRLRASGAAGPASPWRSLWLAWRAARGRG